jgi:hypothetical protein
MAPGLSSFWWLLVLVLLRLLVHVCSAVASDSCSSCCGFWSIFVLLCGSWFIFVLLWLLVSMLLRLLVSVLPWLLGSLLLWLLVFHRSAVWLLVFFLPCGFWFILVLLWLLLHFRSAEASGLRSAVALGFRSAAWVLIFVHLRRPR